MAFGASGLVYPFRYADRVMETTTSTGTGNVAMGGAVTGFQAFATAFPGGDSPNIVWVYYTILSGTNWEVGWGRYNTSGANVLSRFVVLDGSSGPGNPITLAGTSQVFCDAPAPLIAQIDANQTPGQIATRLWNSVNVTESQYNGAHLANAFDMCFDGAYLWTINWQNPSSVSWVNVWSPHGASVAGGIGGPTGSSTPLASITSGFITPAGICCSGGWIWVSDYSANTVSQISCTTTSPTVVNTFAVGNGPMGMCFDGQRIWVCNNIDATMSVISYNGGTWSVSATVSLGYPCPVRCCFDGYFIWVTTNGSPLSSSSPPLLTGPSPPCSLVQIQASNQTLTGSLNLSSAGGLNDICFDGTNLWVCDIGYSQIIQLIQRDGLYATPQYNNITSSPPQFCCFDGYNVWFSIANESGQPAFYRARPIIGVFDVEPLFVTLSDDYGYGMAFDGHSMWALSASSQLVQIS